MSRADLKREAAAWRECAEWCDKKPDIARHGLCYLFRWADLTLGAEPLSRFPLGAMQTRVEESKAGKFAQTGCYLHRINDEEGECPLVHARVIFCLFMAIECEEEARHAPK